MVTNFISDKAKIGNNVKIWHFTYVGDDTEIGDNVKIGSLVHIDYNVKIGDNSMIEGSVYIPPLSRIGKNVFIGPAASLTNDSFPPSGKMVGVTIEDNAIIGSRAVIKAGVKIGKNSVVAMGAVVTKDVPENTVVIGVPAKAQGANNPPSFIEFVDFGSIVIQNSVQVSADTMEFTLIIHDNEIDSPVAGNEVIFKDDDTAALVDKLLASLKGKGLNLGAYK